ncbi:FAD-dependent oxidoreductase [Klenkia brasiliensis]|uniref:D-amino-acid oxidase n=1 Tax=Klenkia brasiliensis TaxID=333142 RepID=A0A1G7ZE74_9ACTN|nr:FAD-dependent oxidoreductase [Klenkia brasiliensis]SDH07008.1 D-amino-acid:oxygen oxidoreductase [Klenkia brasiliensis]
MGLEGARVTVVGAGVVGLSAAHDLAAAGATVLVVGDRAAHEGVSGVAGGLWFPYRVTTPPGADDVLLRSRARFEELADRPGTAVTVRAGTVVERTAAPDRSWTAAAIGPREARADELPAGAASGVRASLPVADTPHYLRWLRDRCGHLGVVEQRAQVHDLDATAAATAADLVVLAAGGRSGELVADPDPGHPVGGQVVRLRNPGLVEWLLDEEDPAGLTYVIPRGEDVVCGGTADPWPATTAVDPGVQEQILRRVVAAVPALAGQDVLGAAYGLRPARATLRLGPVPGGAVPVVACYGHGGAGLTLSWGCAEAVVRFAAALLGPRTADRPGPPTGSGPVDDLPQFV